MKIKGYIFIFAFLFIASTTFAMSPRIEVFSVNNYSSKEVVINVEFWEGESEEIHNYMWTQEISGMRITIRDFMSVVHRNVIPPYGNLDIIQYFPRAPLEELTGVPVENGSPYKICTGDTLTFQ